MAATQQQYIDTMRDNIAKKTGKSVDEWVTLVKAEGIEKHGQIIKYLKSEHGFTHGYANFVAISTKGEVKATSAEDTDLIDAQYAKKADLRPIYDTLVEQISAFGDDVEIAPKKAYVSMRRSKQFALLQPSTKTRFDVGFVMRGVEPTERLEAAGSWNSMCTHRVRVTAIDQVDDQLVGWLRQAYDLAG